MPFVAARCPQCGGEIQVDNQKETGFCMHCGSKIIVQEALRTVRIDNTHMMTNWIEIGNRALESENLDEAYTNYTKVLEIQPDNWEIIFKRGKVAGRQSTLLNPKLIEAATAFATAVNLAPNAERSRIIDDSILELTKLALGFMSMRLDLYKKYPDEEEAYAVIEDVDRIKNVANQFRERTGFALLGYFEAIARLLHMSVISAFNGIILPEYQGNDNHPDDYEFKQFLTRIILCNKIVNIAIELSENDEEEDIKRYETMILLEEHAIRSCSYDYEINNYGTYWRINLSLNDEAKKALRNKIAIYENKIDSIDMKKQREETARREEIARRAAEQAKKREEAYWKAHPLEHQSYLDNVAKKNKVDSEISRIRNERAKLGIFAGKEKKELDRQLNELQNNLSLIEKVLINIKRNIG